MKPTACRAIMSAGVNFLLITSDVAVDLFLDMLKEDTGTVEAHLTLGNLFRSRAAKSTRHPYSSNALMESAFIDL